MIGFPVVPFAKSPLMYTNRNTTIRAFYVFIGELLQKKKFMNERAPRCQRMRGCGDYAALKEARNT